jgi:predicted GNAT superfamily acetyltransferase
MKLAIASSTSRGWSIRPLADADRAALLRLNEYNWPAVHTLDTDTLAWLLGFGGHHFVAVDRTGAVLGYLLSFASQSNYDDDEIRELRRLTKEPFLYICQVVIARDHRGRGIGRAFYEEVADAARREGTRLLCCDVNTNPPNPGSFAFHRRLGFVVIGSGTASNGMAIAFLARSL